MSCHEVVAASGGERVPGVSSIEKVCGRAKYTADLRWPGALVGKVVRSKHPHARVKHIDTTSAERIPGVVAIVKAENIRGANTIGKVLFDQPVLVTDYVRCSMDALCLIAAEDEKAALAAMDAVHVDLEVLAPITDPRDAMKPEAVRIHPDGNIAGRTHIRRGDTAVGFKEAAIVVENTFRCPPVDHAFLEPEAAVAVPDPQGITVYVGCQNPYMDRDMIAWVTGLQPSKVRVVVPYVGGAFGGKDEWLVGIYAALLAQQSGRPVRIVFSREESFLGRPKSHAMEISYKTGVRRDGTITAVEVEIIADTGAYAHWGPKAVAFAAIHAVGPYRVDNVKIDAYAVYTNNMVGGTMRGWETPQVAFACESQMDMVAAAIGMDPLLFRKKNLVGEGDCTVTGQVFPPGVGIKRTLAVAEQLVARMRVEG